MTREIEAAERTSGKKNAERKNERSQAGIFDCTSTASASATASCTATATITKANVLMNEIRTVGSVMMSAKLSSPTNSGGLSTSQRKNASTTDATIGIRVNRVSPMTVG